jgi:hypothetical protein
MSEPKPDPRRVNLEIPADLPAVYANFVIITHSPWEVFLDFAQILPNLPKARVRTRLVLTPANAKMLLRALNENIDRYEAKHGEINVPSSQSSLADQLFGTIRPNDEPDNNPEGDPNE